MASGLVHPYLEARDMVYDRDTLSVRFIDIEPWQYFLREMILGNSGTFLTPHLPILLGTCER